MKIQHSPIGIKIISILYHITSILGLVYGILFLVVASKPSLAPKANVLVYYLAYLNPFLTIGGILVIGFVILNGIILIGLGILGYFVGRGLWKGQNWASVAAIIFAILGVLISAGIIFQQGNAVSLYMLGVIINLGIIGYLIFINDAKSIFS